MSFYANTSENSLLSLVQYFRVAGLKQPLHENEGDFPYLKIVAQITTQSE